MRYLVVGGFAVAAHGFPRYTKDLDLWLDCTPENAARVVAALADFGFGSLNLTVEDFTTPDLVIQLGYEPNRVDLLTGLTGVVFETAYPRRVSTTIDGAREVSREIAPVVRIAKLGAIDERAERRAYWAARSIEERIREVESLRRMWPELTGDADAPIVKVVHRRRLGDPAPRRPTDH